MKLNLTLTGPDVGGDARRSFDAGGGTVGRSAENDWVLPDPNRHLSKTHCRILSENGRFVLVDTSTNGTYLNHDPQPVGRNNRAILADGDRIRLGDYVIRVGLERDQPSGARMAPDPQDTFLSKIISDRPAAVRDDGVFTAATPTMPPPSSQQPGAHIPDDFDEYLSPPPKPPPKAPAAPGMALIPDDEDLLMGLTPPAATEDFGLSSRPTGSGAARPAAIIPEDEDLMAGLGTTPEAEFTSDHSEFDHLPSENQRMRLGAATPDPSLPTGGIPDDWDLDPAESEPPATTRLGHAVPRPAPTASRTPRPHHQGTPDGPRHTAGGGGDEAIAAFMAAAGLADLEIPPERLRLTMGIAGAVLALAVDGLWQLLAARGAVRTELRLEQTLATASNNSAFKVAQSGQEALATLLTGPRPVFMEPIAAVNGAVEDIAAHNMAVMAGIQGALTALLKRFDPKALEAKLDGQRSLSSILPGNRKAKYWEVYEQMYREIAAEAEDDFRSVVGREFGEAYAATVKKSI